MPQVLLVNPSERKAARKGKKMAKTKRTAAQRRATAKLVALNKARRSGSSAKPKRRRAARTVTTRLSNPAPKRRRSTKRAATSAGRVLRHRRRNPIGGMGEFVSGTLMPSVIGGGGALALDVMMAMLPLPPALKVGALAPIVKIAGAVGLGMLAGQMTSRRTANQIAAGALTVTMYSIAKGMLVRMSGGKIPGLAEYVSDYPDGAMMGEYVSGVNEDGTPQLSYISPGQQVGDYEDAALPAGMGDDIEGYETGVYR